MDSGQLTDNNKNRLRACKEIKQHYLTEGEILLAKIKTCDESLIYYYEPEL